MRSNLPAAGRPEREPSLPTADPTFSQLPWPDEPFFEEGINWRRYFLAVLRFKWFILGVTVVGTVLGVAMSRTIEPVYEGQTTLWIETLSRSDARSAAPGSSELLPSRAWIDVLYSGHVFDHIVRSMRLYLSTPTPEARAALADFGFTWPESVVGGQYRLSVSTSGDAYVLEDVEGEVVEQGAVGDSIGVALGFAWQPQPGSLVPGSTIEFSVANPAARAGRLRRSVQAELDGSGSFLTLAMRGRNPRGIATTLNAVADRLMQVGADLKRESLREKAAALGVALERARAELREAESQYEGFRVEANPPGPEAMRGVMESNFFALKARRDSVQRDQDGIRQLLETAADSGLSISALLFIGSVQSSPDLTGALQELAQKRNDLRTLRYDYSDDYPPVRALLAQIEQLERHAIPQLANELLDDLADVKSDLDRLMASASAELRGMPPLAIEEARRARQVEVAENLARDLDAKYQEARLAAQSEPRPLRVMDPAITPSSPTNSASRQRMIAVALMMSLTLGVALAVLLELIDPRLRYPEQVSDDLGIRILGSIPHLPTAGGWPLREHEQTLQDAFRTVRLSLAHSYGAAGPIVITISSPGEGEGKSFVSCHLGVAFSQLGLKTIIVDADTRRGVLHRRLACERKPGLTDYLGGKASLEEVIQSTQHGPSIIASGTRYSAGPELLQSVAMPTLIAHLRTSYEAILIDSPPLAAGVDAFALATLTGNLVLVVRTGTTDRGMALAKLQLLDPLPTRLLGAVLNALKPQHTHRYHYYTSHYYNYLPGYEPWDEQSEAEEVDVLPAAEGREGSGPYDESS